MRLAFQQAPRNPDLLLKPWGEFTSSGVRPPSKTDGRSARTYVIVQITSKSTVTSDEKSKIADIAPTADSTATRKCRPPPQKHLVSECGDETKRPVRARAASRGP